jgi:phage baseplate assembly protein W
MSELSFLGRGWGFPPTFTYDPANKGEIWMVSETEDVAQSIQILLATRPGERVMRPDFGCNLDRLLFRSVDMAFIADAREIVETAIITYEPRVTLNRVTVNTSQIREGVVLIEIDYTIRIFNTRFNLVYPFYLDQEVNL